MLGWLIAIILNHPFMWEKENGNWNYVGDSHLPLTKHLPFVFTIWQIQPFGSAVVAQNSIEAFCFIATETFQARQNVWSDLKMLLKTFMAYALFWNYYIGFLSIILLYPDLTWHYITFSFSLPCFFTFLQLHVCIHWCMPSYYDPVKQGWEFIQNLSGIRMWFCKVIVCVCVFRVINQDLWFALGIW